MLARGQCRGRAPCHWPSPTALTAGPARRPWANARRRGRTPAASRGLRRPRSWVTRHRARDAPPGRGEQVDDPGRAPVSTTGRISTHTLAAAGLILELRRRAVRSQRPTVPNRDRRAGGHRPHVDARLRHAAHEDRPPRGGRRRADGKARRTGSEGGAVREGAACQGRAEPPRPPWSTRYAGYALVACRGSGGAPVSRG
jgi:hypothetical protein